MNQTITDDFMSTMEAARALKRHPDSVRKYAADGLLPVQRFGPKGRLQFRRGDVLALLARREREGARFVDAASTKGRGLVERSRT